MGSEQPQMGIMLYGYLRSDAMMVKDSISACMGYPIDLIDASGMDEKTIMEVLDSGGSDRSLDADIKVLMFLGFDDEGIGTAMDHLRNVQGIKRPIFCCLTAENVNWKMKDLLMDLQEEDRYFRSKNSEVPRG